MSYEFRGATANGLLVFLAAWSGGGSGTFYYLHILDAASNRAFVEAISFSRLASKTKVSLRRPFDRGSTDDTVPLAR
jgi:hypothetical protein